MLHYQLNLHKCALPRNPRNFDNEKKRVCAVACFKGKSNVSKSWDEYSYHLRVRGVDVKMIGRGINILQLKLEV